jgi:hypothetical protein
VKRILGTALVLLAVSACDAGGGSTPPATSFAPGCDNVIVTCMEQRTTPPPSSIDPTKKYSATVHTNRGDFVIALVDPKIAPQTVNNFVYLSQNHFYDGLTFHRVVAGFVVQATRLETGPAARPTSCPTRAIPRSGRAERWVWRRAPRA